MYDIVALFIFEFYTSPQIYLLKLLSLGQSGGITEHVCKSILTITERMTAGIPKASESKLRMAQMMVVTKASARKSCGASKFGD